MEEQEVLQTSWVLVAAEEGGQVAPQMVEQSYYWQVELNYFFGDQRIAYSWVVMLDYSPNDSGPVVVVAAAVTIVFPVEPYRGSLLHRRDQKELGKLLEALEMVQDEVDYYSSPLMHVALQEQMRRRHLYC